MTKEEILYCLKADSVGYTESCNKCMYGDKTDVGTCYSKHLLAAIKALEQEPCEDAISCKKVIDTIYHECSGENLDIDFAKVLLLQRKIKALPPVQPERKTGHCKDCKWWKDSDGSFRRGIRAESKCPMNRKEVYEGYGYCFMFEPRDGE